MEKYLFVGVGGMIGSVCGGELSGLLYGVMGDRVTVVGYFDSDELNQGCLSFDAPSELAYLG